MDVRAEGPVTLFTAPFVRVALSNMALCIGSAFAIHLPGFLRELGAGEAEVGRIISAHALAALLGGPLVGRLMDVRGRQIAMRAGSALYVLAAALYLTVDEIGPFVYGVRVLEGVSAALLYASLFTFAADVVPAARRTEGLAVFGASGLVTMGVSGALGDLILAAASYRAMFATALGFGVLGLLLCWPLRDVHRSTTSAAAIAEGGVVPAIAKAPPLNQRAAGPLLQRDLLAIWAAAFAFFTAMSALLVFFKTFVLATGHGSVGGFFMVYSLVAVLLRFVFGWIPDRVGLSRMVLPSLSSYALGVSVLALADSDAQVLLAAVLCGVGHSYAFPVLYSLVIARAHPAQRGAAMGIYTSIDWGGMLVAGPLLGLLIESAGYTTAFLALSTVLLLGIALFYALDPRSPRPR